jgi:predicted phosphoribosyltransferase
MQHRYRSRHEAGRVLSEILARHGFAAPPIVVALPRGGVPVACEVAQRLGAPLDFIVVRKIGAPGQGELACGALVLGGDVVWNTGILRALRLTTDDLKEAIERETAEARSREALLRSAESPALEVAGASVIIVDDGLATGATMKAAVRGIQARKPKEVIVAVPVGPASACREIEKMGCALVCDQRIDEETFSSVGQWYDEFPQVSTTECRELLIASRRAHDEK